ncbi:MAG: polyamine aminopropyltransferase [bacterium]
MNPPAPAGGPPWFRESFSKFYGVSLAVNREILHTRSEFQDIFLFENDRWGKVLVLDGAVQLTEGDEFFYHEALVWPPMLLHPDPRRVLIIGGGDGGTLEEVLKFPTVETVMQVEIDPAVVEIAKTHFDSVHHGAFDDPRVHLVIADAAKFVPADPERYDVILMDTSDPVGPSEPLYDKIFLARVRDHLTAGGILGMQSGSALIKREVFERIQRDLNAVLSWVLGYAAPVPTYPGGIWTFTMGAMGASRSPPTKIAERLAKMPAPQFVTPGFLSDLFSPPQYLTGARPGP